MHELLSEPLLPQNFKTASNITAVLEITTNIFEPSEYIKLMSRVCVYSLDPIIFVDKALMRLKLQRRKLELINDFFYFLYNKWVKKPWLLDELLITVRFHVLKSNF